MLSQREYMSEQTKKLLEEREVMLPDGGRLPYVLERKKRRTLGVYVFPDGKIVLRIPLRASLREAEVFLLSRADWVDQHRQRALQQFGERPRLFDAGASTSWLGEPVGFSFRSGGRISIALRDGVVQVVWPESDWGNEERLERHLQQWRIKEGRLLFQQRVDEWHDRLRELKLPQPVVKVRHMRTRWGSCSVKAVVTLNAELMKMPLELIDYVVLHELCHLREFNHGPRFYALMTRFMPDWQSRRQALRERARQELAC